MLRRTTSLIPTCSRASFRRHYRQTTNNNNAILSQRGVQCNWFSQTTKHYARIPSSSPSGAGSMYTAPKKEGFQIPAQGFLFMVLLVPVAFMATYKGRYGPTDETVAGEVGERYAGRIAENRAKRSSHMADFFQSAIHQPKDGTKVDEDLHKLLIAGKGGKKRMHAVDEKLYGTAEGVAEKTRQEEQRKEMEEIKRKKKAGEAIVDDENMDKKSGGGY